MHWTRRIAKGADDSGRFPVVPLLLGLFMLVLHLTALHAALLLDRELLLSAQIWRLIGAHFVHWSDWHLAMNLGGLLVLPLLCDLRWSLWRWSYTLVVLALAVSFGTLLLAPGIDRYAGFSGVLHGLFMLGLWPATRAGDRIAAVCLLYLAGKIIVETVVGPLFADPDRLGAAVAHQAHLAGAAGAMALLGCEALGRRLQGN